jgi:hypothetical protein
MDSQPNVRIQKELHSLSFCTVEHGSRPAEVELGSETNLAVFQSDEGVRGVASGRKAGLQSAG